MGIEGCKEKNLICNREPAITIENAIPEKVLRK